MKKFFSLLLLLAAVQAFGQQSRIDSLQAMPAMLFTPNTILNCTLQGYKRAYVYRFQFKGPKTPIKASLRYEYNGKDDYPFVIASQAMYKSWYDSKEITDYLREWTFEIVPSHDTFKFGAWMEGINPHGETDRMYTQLPGGKFSIVKGLDTADYRHWKLFLGATTAIPYDSTSVARRNVYVNFDPSDIWTPTHSRKMIVLTVYSFWNKTNYVGIARWGDLFFPFYYGNRDKSLPQFQIYGVQQGFE